MSKTSTRLLFGIGLAGLIMECIVMQPAFAADKVTLFKVITAKDEIVIGLTDAELAQVEGNNAGGIARMLVAKGSMSAWQYAVRKAATGELEQAPLRQVGLIASELLRVEPYVSPLKVVPIEESQEVTANFWWYGTQAFGAVPGMRTLRRNRQVRPVSLFALLKGPPRLCCYVFPQKHLLWGVVSPRGWPAFTACCADLCGDGGSGGPPSLANIHP